MTINDLVNEMAMDVTKRDKNWEEIVSALIDDKDAKKAVDLYLKHNKQKGSPAVGKEFAGLKRSWNAAAKIDNRMTPSLYKFMETGKTEEQKKASTNAATATSKEQKKKKLTPEEAKKQAEGLKVSADISLNKIRGVDSNYSWRRTDYLKKMSKELNLPVNEVLKKIRKQILQNKSLATSFEKHGELSKIPFADRTPKQKAEWTKLNDMLLPRFSGGKEYDLKQIEKMKEVKSSVEFKKLIKDIKNTINRNITDNKFQKAAEKAIRRISTAEGKITDFDKPENEITKSGEKNKNKRAKSMGPKATELNDLLKTITGAKKGADVSELQDKTAQEIKPGLNHIKQVDSFLKKYDSAKDISQSDINKLVDGIKEMIPVMKADATTIINKKIFDKTGLGVYSSTLRKLEKFFPEVEKNNPSLDVDKMEDAIDSFSKYHSDIEKNIVNERKRKQKAEAERARLSMKEDIMFNLQ